MKILVIGGGAAGFFAAIAAKQKHPHAHVQILEKANRVLNKVRISGGGRCNVTHACFEPKELVKNYPRGSKELLGPFHRFQPLDTLQWFSERGVELKKEKDGRMFPTTDSSQTIIDCLLNEAKHLRVELLLKTPFDAQRMSADRIILATGSAKSGWELAQRWGHTLQTPVPSLFTFNIPNFPLESLSGISVENARLKIRGTRLSQEGPLLITHWGFSGPAALKLSAFGARLLFEKSYEVELEIDWLPEYSTGQLLDLFQKQPAQKALKNVTALPLPKRLAHHLCPENQGLGNLKKTTLRSLCDRLKGDLYKVRGKTTNKEEFVTCGGVTLSEVNFKTMESKIRPGLYFCGEVLDIDGVTGGFNFQNAWTTAWIAGTA